MRVLRLTPFFHHEGVAAWPARYDAVGGMQIQTLRTSRWLARRGVEQLVLTLGFPGLPAEYQVEPGLTVRTCRLPLPELASETTGLVGLVPSWAVATLAALERLPWQPDVVHVHADGELYPLLLSWWAARRLGRPCVLTIHCSRLASRLPVSRWDAVQNRAARAAERKACRAAAAVTALNPVTAAAIHAACEVTPRVIPDAIDVSRFVADPAATAAFCATYGVPRDRPIIAFIGRIAVEKGWRDLAPLVRAVPDAHLLVVGDGPQAARFRQALGEAGVADRVTITGFVPQAAVVAALDAAHVVVMPSRHEELGGTALEAMAMRRPVVAYAVGGLRSTVGAVFPELLVPAGDRAALIERVTAVLAGSAGRAAKLEAAREWVAAHFHTDAVLGDLVSTYAAVAR